MNSEDLTKRVSIIAFGCDSYDELPDLSNVEDDLARIKRILCNSEYSVFSEHAYTKIYNKPSSCLRTTLQEYLFNRSADQDILILFFSGHGVAIGANDFGFCMKDAKIHPEDQIVLPLSVVKLSEIIGTLKIKDVSIILIVDSCYSGQVSKGLKLSFDEVASEMSTSLVASSGNLFGIITSGTSDQLVRDEGYITKALMDLFEQGVEENVEFICMGDLTDEFQTKIAELAKGDITPRVFIPSGRIFKLPIAKNVQYVPPREPITAYSFTNPYLLLLTTLWNNGNPISLSIPEILERTGSSSAYANHNKLSLEHWDLLCTTEDNKRELTPRGVDFIQGNLVIPKTIMVNKDTHSVKYDKDAPMIRIVEDKDQFGNVKKTFVEVVK